MAAIQLLKQIQKRLEFAEEIWCKNESFWAVERHRNFVIVYEGVVDNNNAISYKRYKYYTYAHDPLINSMSRAKLSAGFTCVAMQSPNFEYENTWAASRRRYEYV
jgi:hypothetical protein